MLVYVVYGKLNIKFENFTLKKISFKVKFQTLFPHVILASPPKYEPNELANICGWDEKTSIEFVTT